MIFTHEEFLRRLLRHILPKGFPRIRHFGFLANRRRGQLLSLCRTLLCKSLPARETPTAPVASSIEHAILQCPRCQGSMQILERLTSLQILSQQCRQVQLVDSSQSPKRSVELCMLLRTAAIRVPARADQHCSDSTTLTFAN
jgi:Putative transposase